MQLDIVQVITGLARLTKTESSVAIVSAVSDVMRHLRKSIHFTLDDANLGDDLRKWNRRFHEAVDECLIELSSKVALALSMFYILRLKLTCPLRFIPIFTFFQQKSLINVTSLQSLIFFFVSYEC